MALKGSPNKNRKKVVKTPITIADIETIRKMDHEQLYAQLEKTLGSTKKVVDESVSIEYNDTENSIFNWKFISVLGVLVLFLII